MILIVGLIVTGVNEYFVRGADVRSEDVFADFAGVIVLTLAAVFRVIYAAAAETSLLAIALIKNGDPYAAAAVSIVSAMDSDSRAVADAALVTAICC